MGRMVEGTEYDILELISGTEKGNNGNFFKGPKGYEKSYKAEGRKLGIDKAKVRNVMETSIKEKKYEKW